MEEDYFKSENDPERKESDNSVDQHRLSQIAIKGIPN